MILIMRTALRAFVPANRVGRFQIMVSSGVALNSEMHASARALKKTVTDNESLRIRKRKTDRMVRTENAPTRDTCVVRGKSVRCIPLIKIYIQ